MVIDMMKVSETTPNLFEQINHPKDPNNMTDLEKKHLPKIECPDIVEANKPFDVTINIGSGLDHPSELAHFIQWISLGRDDANMTMCEEVMQPKFTRPTVTFRIALDRNTVLVARESCNLHGIWENKKQVTVR
jgi:superoxide reductase